MGMWCKDSLFSIFDVYFPKPLRVPMIVRGPHVSKNKKVKKAVLNIDIAPTIFEIVSGQTKAVRCMDGMSFLPIIDRRRRSKNWRTDFLISYRGATGGPNGLYPVGSTRKTATDAANNTYHCLRTIHRKRDSIYCHFLDREGFVEFYNLSKDKWQLNNTAKLLTGKTIAEFEGRLRVLKKCQGLKCRKGGAAAKSAACPATTPDGLPMRRSVLVNICMNIIFSKQKCKCSEKACIDFAILKKCGRTLVTRGQKVKFRAAANGRVNFRCHRNTMGS